MFHFPVLEIPKELSGEKGGRGRATADSVIFKYNQKKSASRKLGIFKASQTFVQHFKTQREKQNKKEQQKPILKFP